MPENATSRALYDYNIYRISRDKVSSCIEFLIARRFEEIPLRQDLVEEPNGFTFTLLFCDKDNNSGSPWMKLLTECSIGDLTRELKVYGAALVCYSDTACFIISFGNAHFYLTDYCDESFGIRVAERLVNPKDVKAQQNLSHGSRVSRTYMDFHKGVNISYRGGEIPSFIKGRSINKDEWGEFINCGVSAQFRWKERPLRLGKKLALLENALNTRASYNLPRLIELDEDTDSDKIQTIKASLVESIRNIDSDQSCNNYVSIPSFYISGTQIVQNNSVHYRLTCKHKVYEVDGELGINSLNAFSVEKGVALEDIIDNGYVSITLNGGEVIPRKRIINYLEYITSDNLCVRDGKWYEFNNAYLDRIFGECSGIEFYNHIDDVFDVNKQFLIDYAKQMGKYEAQRNQPYETYYNTYLSNELCAVLVHPTPTEIGGAENGRYRSELCDIYKDGELFFVKIGEPSDFSYAVDQALLTLDRYEANAHDVTLPDGTEMEPRLIRLVLIFDKRRNIVEEWRNILSVNFLLRLTDMRRRINYSSVKMIVDFVYFNLPRTV